MYGLTNSITANNNYASSSSKRRGRLETEDGALSPENGPGAYRVRGNRRSEHDDIISQTLEEPSTAVGPIRIPHAELVVDDQDENRMEIERALQAAAIERANRQEIERVLHAAAQENQSIIDRAVLTARLGGQAVEEGQSRDDTHPENEENKITTSSEDRSSFRQYIKPITIVSFLVLLLAIFAFVITFLVRNSSDKSGATMTKDLSKPPLPVIQSPAPTDQPTTVSTATPTFRPTEIPTSDPTVAPTTTPTGNPTGAPTAVWLQRGPDVKETDVEADSGGQFGNSVSLSSAGNILAVAAPTRNTRAGSAAGLVRVFEYDSGGDQWKQLGDTLMGAARLDLFGALVDLSATGKVLAIGASEPTTGRPGYARVLNFNEATKQWDAMGSTLTGINDNDRFGHSVALSEAGTTLAVGANRNSGNGVNAGHVRVFSYNGILDEWTQRGPPVNGTSEDDQFGFSVDLSADGNILAVGAPAFETERTGYVRVFEFNGNSNEWDPLGPDFIGAGAGDLFGHSVALSWNGMRLAVGASGNDDTELDSGHVLVFEYSRSTNKWTEAGPVITGLAAGDRFGISVSLSADGNTLAVGAFESDASATESGHVRIFRYNTAMNEWDQLGSTFTGSNAEDHLGLSVSLSAGGSVVACGADQGPARKTGYVRVYESVQ